MKLIIKTFLLVALPVIFYNNHLQKQDVFQSITFPIIFLNSNLQMQDTFQPREVYRSHTLIITQLTASTFQHTSYKQTNDFGNVPCNGLIVRNGNESIVFDTPTKDSSAAELISWIQQKLQCKINAIIPTHFHDDCLGGLQAFHDNSIPSYGYFKTIEMAKANKYVIPRNSFPDSLTLPVGDENIKVKFFGEGHTKDNVVGYYPAEQVLFGGCLIKELEASKGYLGDANEKDWSGTVEKIKLQYPDVKVVVPGHGEPGNIGLLDYTIQLFRKH
jgi:metallo-beta-lactamase class B